jgi:hypothetical protein
MNEKYLAAHIKTPLDAAAINIMRTMKNQKGKTATQWKREVWSAEIADKSAGEKNSWELQTIDLRNGATSMIPSSKHFVSRAR